MGEDLDEVFEADVDAAAFTVTKNSDALIFQCFDESGHGRGISKTTGSASL